MEAPEGSVHEGQAGVIEKDGIIIAPNRSIEGSKTLRGQFRVWTWLKFALLSSHMSVTQACVRVS